MPTASELQDPSPSTGVGAAPLGVRALAFLVDATLAGALVLGLRLAAVHGLVRPLGAWRPGAPVTWFDWPAVILAVFLVAGRDVPFGSSFAKWLLCLRPVARTGARLPLRVRLQRAALQFLPLTLWRRGRRGDLPWRVEAYAPSSRGLAVRGGLAIAAAVWSLVYGLETLRPSIGRGDAEQLARATVIQDPGLQAELGAPLEFEVYDIAPRSHLVLAGTTATFALRVRGAQLRQEMVVHAIKVDGRWAVDEIVDIRIAGLDAAPGDTVAVR